MLNSALQQFTSFFPTLFVHPDIRSFLDIAIVSVVIYQILKMFLHTRASSVVKGVAIVLLVTWLSEVLQLNAINWLLVQVLNTGAILLIVIFQPELRRGLEQIGRTGRVSRFFGLGSREQRHCEQMIAELVGALTELSRKRVGALIVVEQVTGLADFIESGTVLDAEISSALIQNVFEPNTPLHDGAAILRGHRIAAAGCILQLTEDNSLSRELGTRHRAAIGITETTDAISLIVSEETGIISTARNGRLSRYLDKRSLTTLLSELYMPKEFHWSQLFAVREEEKHEFKK